MWNFKYPSKMIRIILGQEEKGKVKICDLRIFITGIPTHDFSGLDKSVLKGEVVGSHPTDGAGQIFLLINFHFIFLLSALE